MSPRDCRSSAYICINGQCDCSLGYRPNELNDSCVGGIGQRCMYDNHCVTNAYCRDQLVCACKDTHPLVSDDYWSCSGK